jgi:hypothetical protein
VFVTGHASPTYVAYAACGDRLPVAIDVRDNRHWNLEPDGLRHAESARVVDGTPVRWTRWIPLEAIKAVAARQPPFDPRGQPADARAVGALRPIELDVPVADRAEGRDGSRALLEVAAPGAGPPERRLALVDALLGQGADVNATNAYGYTPLMLAASRGDADLIRRLLRQAP